MSIKWLGAALILTGCGGFGFTMAAGVREQMQLLKQLIRVLGILESELQYRLTSLPELCTLASVECSGSLRAVFREVAQSLSRQESPDAAAGMETVLDSHRELPGNVRKHLRHLGRSLGRFDLPGQVSGLQALRRSCESDLSHLRKNADVRQQSYQTLALCAGTALVILFV